MSDPRIKRCTEVLNVQMPLACKAMVKEIARDEGVSAAKIVRELIELRYGQKFNNQPSCATGQRCLCPGMHSVQTQKSLTPDEMLAARGNADNGPAGQEGISA